jgi:hypothetical protein
MNIKNNIPQAQVVKPLIDYKIYLEFDDGVRGEIDLAYLKGKGVFEWWEKDNNFSKVHIDRLGNVVWNENIDIDSLNCYLKITNQTFEQYADS